MKLSVLIAFTVGGTALLGEAIADQNEILTSKTVESLLSTTDFVADDSLSLTLEPGVRAIPSADGFSLSTYDGAKIALVSATGMQTVLSPAIAKRTNAGWEINGSVQPKKARFVVTRMTQDDTDSNLKSMQESAKKLKAKTAAETNKPNQKRANLRFLFGSSNPWGGSEAFSRTAIQQLTHISGIGF